MTTGDCVLLQFANSIWVRKGWTSDWDQGQQLGWWPLGLHKVDRVMSLSEMQQSITTAYQRFIIFNFPRFRVSYLISYQLLNLHLCTLGYGFMYFTNHTWFITGVFMGTQQGQDQTLQRVEILPSQYGVPWELLLNLNKIKPFSLKK